MCTNFGEAINLTRSWQVQAESTSESQVDSGICPYKGLEFFDCNDEDPKYFFGREQLVGQLLDQVRTSNFLALVGASGNGKSSVLRAGLLHQLKLGRRISRSDQWRIRITRPDRQPMQNLALAFVDEGPTDLDRAAELVKASGLLKAGAAGLQQLVQASSSPRTVLVIDQFEEVFTRCESTVEREQFFSCLMGALSDTDDKLCLIIAMRADFIVKCMEQEYSGLARQIEKHQAGVLPMQADELKATICTPAEQVNLQVEPALVTEILKDIEGAPGSLPLLQYTLKELWNQRQNNQITLATYQKLGGIEGTLDQRATAIYNSFDEAEQKTVQHIFQQLTQLGEGTEDTRRRVFQDDLVAEQKHPAQRVQQVIERLSSPENRLIVTSEVVSKSDQSSRMSIVDVAHEALIRHWKLLRQWIEQNRDLLRKQRRIEASAIAWRNQGQKAGYLLQGLPLIEAIQFNKEQGNTFPLSDNGHVFILKSLRQKRLNRLKTSAWLIVPALILLVVVEHNIRESGVRRDYGQLDSEGTLEETQAVESLVRGCYEQNETAWLPSYLAERIYGNCRPLSKAPLAKAKLRFTDLTFVEFTFVDLRGADLSFAHLTYSNLRDADLTGANLNIADLTGANFSNTNLTDADLSFVDLSGANLHDANLHDANLRGANLGGSNLRGTHLRGVIISNTTKIDRKWKLVHKIVNEGGKEENLRNANLIGANLSNANLTGAKLSSADLRDADLRDADLSDADLRNANLNGAKLFSTDLSGTDLSDADFSDADLRNADFSDADLSNANLGGANLSFVDLRDAELSGANLGGAELRDANLSNTILSDANLRLANLKGANLSDANLKGANLIFTDLSNANLSDANLSGANLGGANLSKADLRSADLRSADLRSAILLNTDLREAKNLTQSQLESNDPPLICNSPLPQNIKIDSNRDCDKIAAALHERYPKQFPNLDKAEKHVQEQ